MVCAEETYKRLSLAVNSRSLFAVWSGAVALMNDYRFYTVRLDSVIEY